jgi:hypothetical protein
MSRNYAVDTKGANKVKIRSAGFEKQHAMVMLCRTADGRTLIPYIILNGKYIPKNGTFPKDVTVRAGILGENFWERRPRTLRNPPSMLARDVFRGYVSAELKVKI